MQVRLYYPCIIALNNEVYERLYIIFRYVFS